MADQIFQAECGFFDAVDRDRLYTADQMNRPYRRFVSDGVFAARDGSPSDDFAVVPNYGMQIKIKAGEGMFNNKWFSSDDVFVTVPSNTGSGSRYDSVIIQVDNRVSGRVGNIVYRTGGVTIPEINTIPEVNEYRLANIFVQVGARSMTEGNITDLRGTDGCPWVTSLVYQPDNSYRIDQFLRTYGVNNATRIEETVLFSSNTPVINSGSPSPGVVVSADITSFDYVDIRYAAFGRTGIARFKGSDIRTYDASSETGSHWSEFNRTSVRDPEDDSTPLEKVDFLLEKIDATHIWWQSQGWAWDGKAGSVGKAVELSQTNNLGIFSITGINYVNAGSTKDPELTDIRVGANGTTYPTAGDAVRAQITNTQSMITTLSDNVIRQLNEACLSFPYNMSLFPYSELGLNADYVNGSKFHISGTAVSNGFINIIDTVTNGLPKGFYAGQKVYLRINLDSAFPTGCKIQVFSKMGSTTGDWSQIAVLSKNYLLGYELQIPINSYGIIARLYFTNGTVFDNDLEIGIYSHPTSKAIMSSYDADPATSDLNEIQGENSIYILPDNRTFTNVPSNYHAPGFLQNIYTGEWNLQILYSFTYASIWKRRGTGTSWSNWLTVTYEGNRDALPSSDINTVVEYGTYLLADTNTYTNLPDGFGNLGFLSVSRAGNYVLQIAYPWGNWRKDIFWRRGYYTGSEWSDWYSITDGHYSELKVTNLNEVAEQGWWLLTDGHTYTNIPQGFTLGFLNNVFTGNWRIQILYAFSGEKVYKRRGNSAGTTWEAWRLIGANTYNITNNYDFPEYSQIVTLNATPTITTDTNNYLASTGDTTDRTADILAMLTATGVCRLGAGDFYISNLQMPVGSTLTGCGYATKVHLAGTGDGYAVKMDSHCAVSDLCLIGSETDLTFDATPGGRHGILWQGDYTQHQTAPSRGMVNNVWIFKFSGGGITCYDTGYPTVCALEVVNAYVDSCWAGINISYWSEFHKFTNVRASYCRVGCVNNGGNNVFVNCDFSSSKEIGMLMDNSQGQSPNHTHGSCIGCVFNHTAHDGTSNSGIGIEMLNCGASGFIFTGCQIFFSKIHLVDCDGISFNNCNFGNSNCDIEISGGGTILFLGNMHQAKPPITISNNQNVKFVNCYVKTTGAVVEP